MRALRKAAHQLITIAQPDAYVVLQTAGYRLLPVKLQNMGVHIGSDLRFLLQLWRLYKRLHPKVALHYTIKSTLYGTMSAAMQQRPAINNISGLGTAFVEGGWLRQLLYGIIMPMAAHIFFQNREDHALVHKKLYWRRLRSNCLPDSGVDMRRFLPNKGKKEVKKEGFTFLMVARLITEKGIYEYVDAARCCQEVVPGLRFLLIGSQTTTHRRAIPEAELAHWRARGWIEYLGARSDVLPFLAESDAVVLPSYREGVARSLLEAAAMAKPLIASDIPGCRAIVRDGYNGLLCRAKDSKDLSRAMLQMLRLPSAKRNQWGKNSRTLALRCFNERIVFGAYERKINEIAKEHLLLDA